MAHRLAQVLVLVTLVLLLAGGLVTSTDSGLAVPDWPLSFGGFFPPMVDGVRFEHTHRLIAATVGIFTLILTIWIGKTESRRWVRWLAIACFGSVVLQGILGGLTVLYLLPAPISVAHACLGPILFCLAAALATVTSPTWRQQVTVTRGDSHLSLQIFSALVTVLVFLQILLGAIVRHTSEGVWLHVTFAFLVLILTLFLVTQALNRFGEEDRILRPALFLGFLVTAEFFLGVGAFVFTQVPGVSSGVSQVIFPTLHQTFGAVILATGTVLILRSSREPLSTLRGSTPFRHCEEARRADEAIYNFEIASGTSCPRNDADLRQGAK